MTGLAVGQHHHDEQQDDRAGDPRRQVQQRQPTQAEHEQDLFCGVGIRRQRVAAEHREGQFLGQQRLAHHRAAQWTTDQEALGKLRKLVHLTSQTPRHITHRPS
jgi:hypothetical protein